MDVSLGDFVIVVDIVDVAAVAVAVAAAAVVGGEVVVVVAVAVVAWLPGPQCETPKPEVLAPTRQ